MALHQQTLKIITAGRGMINITDRLNAILSTAAINTGTCHIFLQHTSASLIICENSDADVKLDLENFMRRIAPDEEKFYQHNAEGADDMPAHIRTVLTLSSLTLPVTNAQLNLGTWQGIYLWEHRFAAHERKIIITIQG